jgi:hypothetical protein
VVHVAVSVDGSAVDGPILAVVDGRRRVTKWAELRDAGHRSSVLVAAEALGDGCLWTRYRLVE